MSKHPHTSRPEAEQSVSLDELLGLLGDHHRRRVVTELADNSPVTVEEFVRAADGVAPHSVAITLHHTHLPKLQRAGVVTWDDGAGTVSRGPEFEAVEPLVELFRSNRERLPGDWP